MRYLICFSIGVATGLLLSPDTGEKNLEKAKEKVGDLGRQLEDQLKGDEEDDDNER